MEDSSRADPRLLGTDRTQVWRERGNKGGGGDRGGGGGGGSLGESNCAKLSLIGHTEEG